MKFSPLLFTLLLLSCQNVLPPEWMKYPEALHLQELKQLSKAIKESSGLLYWQNGLWTLNDSGNPPVLYRIDAFGKEAARRIKIKDVENIDWESLAQDSSFFYIGDFGNNKGIRNNLAIHLVAKDSILDTRSEIPITGSISFSYQNQLPSLVPQKNHNFNCEAMVVGEDSIYLFSKNHLDQQCTVYRLPKTPGEALALPGKKFKTEGLITGASWIPEQKLLALLGYNNYQGVHHPFVWGFSDYPANDFFAGQAKRYNLPLRLQTEGIAHYQNLQFLITNERENGEKAKVFLLDWRKAGVKSKANSSTKSKAPPVF